MTAIIRNDEICEMREMTLGSEMRELSLGELDEVSGGFLPFLAAAGVGAVGQGVVLGFAVLGTAAFGYAIYRAASGKPLF
jgi:hypothetical protein